MKRDFFVAIPFTGFRSERQWETACRRLQTSLESILNSTFSDFTVLIAGHETPPIDALDDPRIQFFSVSIPKPKDSSGFRIDKGKKKNILLREVRRRGGGDVFLADADDHISDKLLSHVTAMDHSFGHILREGFVFDLSQGKMSTIPGAWTKSFDEICGTCRILRLAPEDIGPGCYTGAVGAAATTRTVSAGLGRPLNEITWPAAVYVLGTRDTISVEVLRSEERQRRLQNSIARTAIPITDELISEFNLGPLIEDVVG